ncbi:N-acetyltransferase family protein [Peribacillus sp. NPDC097675]|uniref:GNAT family N-acetyltransferase n=1 Tax=Peribacillus sp. NPDC097675 TaxID=3390618 RepID=UPI003CFF0A89
MEFTIRNMEVDDIPQVQHVARTSWHSTYEGIIPIDIQESFLQYAYSDDMMKKRVEKSFIYVSEVAEQIVGFANFSPVKESGEAELAAIYFYPEYQGKGMGTALLQAGIKHSIGMKELFINVEKENEVGTAFYRAKGFEVVSEFDDDFDGHILKTVRMVLNVSVWNSLTNSL